MTFARNDSSTPGAARPTPECDSTSVASAAGCPQRPRDKLSLLEKTLSAIPDFVYAFDRRGRFAYANPAMQSLLGLPSHQLIGRNFEELGYPRELADRLNAHLASILHDGVTVEDEVFFPSPTGRAAYCAFLWGPVLGDDGSVQLVVGVSRDTTRRHELEEALKESEARLRAATELVGVGVYSWDPVTGALDWDDRLRAMWGVPPGCPVDMQLYKAGIHVDDWDAVERAIAACVDPAGDGRFAIEYRVVGRDDGVLRIVATAGQTTFDHGKPVMFIGAALDVTRQRKTQEDIRAREAQFRGFADHSCNLIWIADPGSRSIIYRSAAFDAIFGVSREAVPDSLGWWLETVHPDDRLPVQRALAAVETGEVVQYDYRVVRPGDGAIRRLRDTSFPIVGEDGVVRQIGGIAEDLTGEDPRQAYVVSKDAAEARRLASLLGSCGYRARTFDSAWSFLDMAPMLTPAVVIVDLRCARVQGLLVPRELKARSIAMPAILIDADGADLQSAVEAMKAGAADYLVEDRKHSLRDLLAAALGDCCGVVHRAKPQDGASARLARLSRREREVLCHLVGGETNKMIGKRLGISPRTVELHRAQVMNRLDANNLTELLQTALTLGIRPPPSADLEEQQQPTSDEASDAGRAV